jgi:hypothetical protein
MVQAVVSGVSGQVVVDLVANPGCLELARLAVTSPARRLLSSPTTCMDPSKVKRDAIGSRWLISDED